MFTVLKSKGHDSSIHFVNFVNGQPIVQIIKFKDLPLNKLLFLSDKAVVGSGHEFNPTLFVLGANEWGYHSKLDQKKEDKQAAPTGGIAAAK